MFTKIKECLSSIVGCCTECCTKMDTNCQDEYLSSDEYFEELSYLTYILIKDRWRVRRQIGKGAYGVVFEVRENAVSTKLGGAHYDCYNQETNRIYAMKCEVVKWYDDSTGRLSTEAAIMRLMHDEKRGRHVATVVDTGRLITPYRYPIDFIVMTLLGPNLAHLRKTSLDDKLDPVSVALFGVQAIEALEDLHACRYLHRDVKPGNFTIGSKGYDRHNIYLIDFSSSRLFARDDGTLYPIRRISTFCGTIRYCAPDMHDNLEYGRQHDLISLFYSLIELLTGRLPWVGESVNVYEMKKNISAKKWLKDLDEEYLMFYEKLTALHYDIRPDYEGYRRLFLSILNKRKLSADAPFIWEIDDSYLE
uniref:non-specific serine/threonine protein kinase n=1 Tax=Romanomermis culicivorax TaxID=13658 RepID=A0A915JJQ0_ROMCU